uniref:Si:ch211-241f5.3 n=1 Tax=Scophthalmus maximus TaxID=52904 RepID=A0A8D3BT51_SCOMX
DSLCINTFGSFYCQCKDGFRSSTHAVNFSAETSATYINECLEDPDICGRNANCFNTSPYYSCICGDGFISTTGVEMFHNGDNITCRDIDECQEDDVCGQHATCVNTPGSYHCVCNAGYKKKSGKSDISGNQEQCEGKGYNMMLRKMMMLNKITEQGVILLSVIVTGFTTLSLLSYGNLEDSADGFFGEMKPPENQNFKINSKVVTATVSNRNTSHLSEPIKLTFYHLTQLNKTTHCVFWNSSEEGGAWSARGCSVVESNAEYTVCSCTHLSSFAVLMALYEMEDKFELQLITWLGLCLSLICLLFCILTFSFIRSIKSPRTTIHLHLCINLFIAILIFLAGISRTENRVGCAVVAGLLHFFYLAAFCWMCLEGIQLFRMVVLVFNTNFRTLYMLAGGYGVPAVIVAISALANPKGYGTERYCWLNLKFIWSFLGPACFIIIVNIFFFLITVWKLAQKLSSLNPDLDNLQKIKTFTITAVAQMCVLGTMWIFGCFQFEEHTIAMSYLFTILGSLQGVLLFIMHCLFSKQVREEYGNILSRCCAPQKKSYSEFSYSNSSKAHVSSYLYFTVMG